MPDIMHLLKIHASPEQIYPALTTAEGIRAWWTRDATLESKVGSTAEFGFHQRKVVTRVRIAELTPPTRVKWTTLASNAPGGWSGTTITFELRAEGSDTVLLFAQRGYPRADEGYARVTTGWGVYLHSLQSYIETGTGAPHG
jgi:uncharacterized protein YndB with AHSA1/START domain